MAAEKAETLVGSVAPHMQKSGQPLKCLLYTATKNNEDDWIIFGDFTAIVEAKLYFVSTGARTACPHTIDTGTLNKVVLTGVTTGDVSAVVWGY